MALSLKLEPYRTYGIGQVEGSGQGCGCVRRSGSGSGSTGSRSGAGSDGIGVEGLVSGFGGASGIGAGIASSANTSVDSRTVV